MVHSVVTGAFKLTPDLSFSGLLISDEISGSRRFVTSRKANPAETQEEEELLAKLPAELLAHLESPRRFTPKTLPRSVKKLLGVSALCIFPGRLPTLQIHLQLIIGSSATLSASAQKYLQTLTELASIALTEAMRFESLKDAFDDMSLVNEMAVSLAASLNSEELFHTFITGLNNLMVIDRATMAQLGQEEQSYNLTYVWNAPPDLSRRSNLRDLPLADSSLALALVKREITIDNWLETSPEQQSVTVFHPEFSSQMVIPLITKKRVIGALMLGSRIPLAYQPDNLRFSLLEKLADLFAQALYNSLRYEETTQSAEVDNPTGVYNRNYFDRELPTQVHRAAHEDYRLGLLMIDMDNLKAINDHYLHITGDAALHHIARLIRNTVREADVVARYGGDEFTVILPRCTTSGLEVVAEKTWRAIRNTPLVLEDGRELKLSVSIGGAVYPEDAVTARDLLQQADAALFVAKRHRDQVRIGHLARLPESLQG